jgi:hypothetical protein
MAEGVKLEQAEEEARGGVALVLWLENVLAT